MCLFRFAIWVRRNYLGSEILRSQMCCYMWSEIWGRRDYLGSLSFQNWTADYLGSLESWSDYLGV